MGMIFAVSGYRRVHFNHQIQCPMNNVAMRRRAFELPVEDADENSELKYEFTMNSVHVSNRTEQDWCKFSLWGFSAGRTVISAEAVDLDTNKAWARIDVTGSKSWNFFDKRVSRTRHNCKKEIFQAWWAAVLRNRAFRIYRSFHWNQGGLKLHLQLRVQIESRTPGFCENERPNLHR